MIGCVVLCFVISCVGYDLVVDWLILFCVDCVLDLFVGVWVSLLYSGGFCVVVVVFVGGLLVGVDFEFCDIVLFDGLVVIVVLYCMLFD